MKNEELYLKLPRRGKSLVAPHKAKPQCGAVTMSLVAPHKAKPQHGAVTRSSANRKSQIA